MIKLVVRWMPKDVVKKLAEDFLTVVAENSTEKHVQVNVDITEVDDEVLDDSSDVDRGEAPSNP